MDIIYRERLFAILEELMRTDSPSGYCTPVQNVIARLAAESGYPFHKTNKGCGVITLEGEDNTTTVALLAHVDTLGAMVRSITEKGELLFTPVGGPILPTLDGEYCRIRTRAGDKIFSGTFLSKSPAAHVYDDATKLPRTEENMLVRLDEKVRTKKDVQALGIASGDYIFIEPKTTVTESGFVKSRFLDDKASVAILLTALTFLRDRHLKPHFRTQLFISSYEEVGHGASALPRDLSEVLAVDMGCVGLDLTCTEYDVSICAKDSGGPYDYEMVSRLIALAQERGLQYAVDIYPHYCSDVSAALSAGHDVRGALIGPGVHASHGMERTHWEALENTLKLVLLYLGVA